MKTDPPNCNLYQATTTTGGTCQVLVPFGKDPAPYFKQEADGDILESDWKQVAIVYGSTIRQLLEGNA